jgi:TonB family protein
MRLGCLAAFVLPIGCGGALCDGPCPVGTFLHSSACWTPDQPMCAAVPAEYTATDGLGVPIGPHGSPETRPAWKFIDGMHRRIHPLFSDVYLPSLEGRAVSDPVNQGIVVATADIRVRFDGSLDEVHLSRASGVPEFDRAVLDSITQSAPFPPPPPSIVQRGTTTVRWIFSRPELLACNATAVRVLIP